MKSIQQLIQDLRAIHSQEEIASKVNASQSLISRWEAGHVPSSAEVVVSLMRLHDDALAPRELSGLDSSA